MDLKIRDVAQLLSISETTVRRWLAEGKIPAYRLNKQYRFSRSEIEDWLMQQKLEAAKELKCESSVSYEKGNHKFSLFRALNKGQVLTLDGKSKREIISQTMQHVATQYECDPEVLTDLFMDREQMMSTGLGEGIAVPHSRDFLLNTHFDVIHIVYPKEPLAYDSLDGKPVHLLFFLFASEDRHHLNLLAKIAHIARDTHSRKFFERRPSKLEILDFVKKWETNLTAE